MQRLILKWLTAVLLLMLCLAASVVTVPVDLIVNIPSLGSVQGFFTSGGNVRSFLGVPFAGTQTQGNRFQPPLTLNPWNGVIQATSFKPKCIQTFGDDRGSEDCLYVNIHTPADISQPLPVMVRFQLRSPFNVTKTKVWIHGGGFANGDGRLDGAQFVQNSNRAVIIVTMQYRLNAFGFLVTDFLRRQNRLNLGLLDQRAALEWVKKNIAVFGGDASRITAFGESAGATSIGMHLVAQNGNQNVFSSAILVSGSPTSGPRFDNYKFTDIVLQNSGCSTSSDQIACLRGLSAQALSNLADAAVNSNYAFGPYVDGSYIPIEPGKALNLGLFSKVPILLGSLTNEGTVFVNRDVGNGYTSWLQNKFQTVFNLPTADVNQITTFYPQSSYPSAFAVAADVYGHYKYTCQVRNLADAYARSNTPVYKFRLDYQRGPNFTPGGNAPGFNYGAYHSLDVELLWNLNSLSAFEQELGRAMMAYWVSFASLGEPGTGTSNSLWPRYVSPVGASNGGGQQLYLNLPITSVKPELETFIEDKCAFWGQVRATTGDVNVLAYKVDAGVLSGAVQIGNYGFNKKVTVQFFDANGFGVGVPIPARYTRAVTSNNKLEIWSFSGPTAGAAFTVKFEALDVAKVYTDDNGGKRFSLNVSPPTTTVPPIISTTVISTAIPDPPTSTIPPITIAPPPLPTPTSNVNVITFSQSNLFSGSVRVKNLCFNKRVNILATLTSDASATIAASYSGPATPDGTFETWTFSSALQVVSFTVSFNAVDIGQTFIDDNAGKRYFTGLTPTPTSPPPPPPPSPSTPPPPPPPTLPVPTRQVQVATYSYQNGILSGQLAVSNIAFQKTLSVFYQDLSGTWSPAYFVRAAYKSVYPGNSAYELWTFSQAVSSIRAFYVKYDVSGQSYYDNNGSRNFQV